MRLTEEAKVKRDLKQFFNQLGSYWFMPATHGFGRSGVPDFVVCINGRFVGVECKGTASNKTTALQRAELRKIITAGGVAAVVDTTNIDEFKAAISELATGWAPVPTAFADLRREQDKVLPTD